MTTTTATTKTDDNNNIGDDDNNNIRAECWAPTEINQSVTAQTNLPAVEIPNFEAIQLRRHSIQLRKSFSRGKETRGVFQIEAETADPRLILRQILVGKKSCSSSNDFLLEQKKISRFDAANTSVKN